MASSSTTLSGISPAKAWVITAAVLGPMPASSWRRPWATSVSSSPGGSPRTISAARWYAFTRCPGARWRSSRYTIRSRAATGSIGSRLEGGCQADWMRIDVFTVFAQMVDDFCSHALLGRPRHSGLFDLRCHDLREHTTDVHRTVDDSP